jgi:predicted metal-dependent HD superfamily phosphohydrolase
MGKMPEFEKARNYVLSRLENELSPNLTYHSLKHTLEVVSAAGRLATWEKVGEEDRLLLLMGAYYHDLGFIRQREGHEAVSIQLAEQTLPVFGYSEAHVIVIRGIIQATCLPQSPTNLLESIMADADLDYLGREDFWERSLDLRHELDKYGVKFTDEDWYTYQLRFMQSHKYITASERSLRDIKKQQHLLGIAKLLDRQLK